MENLLSKKTIEKTRMQSNLLVSEFKKWPTFCKLARELALGKQDKEIRHELGITIYSVKTQIKKAKTELGIFHRTQWVPFALRHGLVTLEELCAKIDECQNRHLETRNNLF